MVALFLQGLTLGLSGAVSPGPFQAYLIGQSLRLGWRRALPAALAPLLSDGPIILLMVFILTGLPSVFLKLLQIVGGIFVLYLAWKALMAYRDFQPLAANFADPQRQNVVQAALINFLSPGPYLFWSVLAGPILVAGWKQSPAHGAIFLAGFYAAMVGTLAGLVVLFGTARQLGPRTNRALIGLSALALLVFGLYQLATGLLGWSQA